MSHSRQLAKPPLIIGSLGVVLFLIAVVHHINELLVLNAGIGPLAALLVDGLPALGLAYTGYRLLRVDLSSEEHWIVCIWSLLGLVLLVSVMGATFLIRIHEGRVIAEPIFPLLIAAEAGSLAGVTAGYYNARARKDARQAQSVSGQLEEVNQRLKASNERLEQFTYAVSHDLQEPLRMVTSYLQLLEQQYSDQLDEDAKEFIEYAVDGAERMEDMIDSLLAYSRVETEGDPFEPVDLNAVVDDVLADLQFKIEENDAEIIVNDLPRVEGDSNQLRQVFQNLLDNAIEYSSDNPPRMYVSAERDSSEWIISVRDEGMGIDPEHTDRIFAVFQRLHTPEEHPGTGIGLALCEQIVERHGGKIWVDSELDEGTTFSLTLPVAHDDDER